MVTKNITFGELETTALFKMEEAETSIISSSELAKMLKISKNRANKLAWQLVSKKRLIRIRRGNYLFAPLRAGPKGYWSEHSLLLVSQLLKNKEYYIGFWTALNHYSLTEQIPLATQVVVTQRRRSFSYLGSRMDFIKVDKLGEFQEEKIGGKTVRVATLEQLIVDCLGHQEYCGGMVEISKALWNARERINWDKLRYLAVKSKDAVQRRLGYLLEVLKLPPIKLNEKFVGWRWLDSHTNKKIVGKSKRWGLWLNMTEKEITEWLYIG